MDIRVILVDDHEVVRAGLGALLETEDGISVVAEAADGPSAIRLAHALAPDVVVLDIRLGAIDGIEACRAIKDACPGTAVLMLTSYASDEAVLGALVAGASGFLVKNTGRADFVRAIRTLAAGDSLLDPSVTRRVTERLVALATRTGPDELAELSPREREVLARVALGESNRQIAERLVISEATARNHVSHILDKLGLARRGEAAALAARLHLNDVE